MSLSLQANERKEFRQSSLNDMRKEGNVPGVIYGAKTGNKSIYVNESDLLKVIKENGRNGVISLEIEDSRENVILTDYQTNPLKKGLVHVDFLAVDMGREITTEVRVDLVGGAAGVKDGGVMQQSLHNVSITSTPANIPQSIEVDVTSLQVGETITVADIHGSGEYTINHEEDEVIASILPPRQEEEISTGEKQSVTPPENLEGRETEANKG